MNNLPPTLTAPPQPPKRTGWIVFAVVVSFFFVLSILVNFGLLAKLVLHDGFGTHETHKSNFQERFVMGDEEAHGAF